VLEAEAAASLIEEEAGPRLKAEVTECVETFLSPVMPGPSAKLRTGLSRHPPLRVSDADDVWRGGCRDEPGMTDA
jgi:hypothetical protein